MEYNKKSKLTITSEEPKNTEYDDRESNLILLGELLIRSVFTQQFQDSTENIIGTD